MNTVQMHSILRRLFGYAKHKARTVASSGLVRVAWLRTYLRAGGTSVQLPCATSAAMPMDSPRVGCGWMVLPMSTASAPISMARAISPIMSPACVPTMPPPRILPWPRPAWPSPDPASGLPSAWNRVRHRVEYADQGIDLPLEEEIALALVGIDGGGGRALGHVFFHSGQNTGWRRLFGGSMFEGRLGPGRAHSGHFTHLGWSAIEKSLGAETLSANTPGARWVVPPAFRCIWNSFPTIRPSNGLRSY